MCKVNMIIGKGNGRTISHISANAVVLIASLIGPAAMAPHRVTDVP
jgi:hypothetical protein